MFAKYTRYFEDPGHRLGSFMLEEKRGTFCRKGSWPTSSGLGDVLWRALCPPSYMKGYLRQMAWFLYNPYNWHQEFEILCDPQLEREGTQSLRWTLIMPLLLFTAMCCLFPWVRAGPGIIHLIDCKDIGGGSIHICHQYTQILNTSNVTSENQSINSHFLTVIIIVNKLLHSLKKATRPCFCHWAH